MKEINLDIITTQDIGKSASKKLRNSGKIPEVIS